MASKRILKELKDLQKDPPTSCSAGSFGSACPILLFYYRSTFLKFPSWEIGSSLLKDVCAMPVVVLSFQICV